MQWDDVGYLVSKNKYNENSAIAEFYTFNHGRCVGVIFGATSKKIKNYLQIGNKLYVNYNFKSEGKIGYFKVEIYKVNTPIYFENKKKLLCIVSAMNLIKLLTAEEQENFKIFDLIDDLFLIFNNEFWVKEYIFWELRLIELIGYNLDLKKKIKLETFDNKKKYFIQSSLGKKYIPNFLIEESKGNVNNKNLLEALNLFGDFLEKNILKPNNINYPISRLEFVNLFR